MKEFQYYTGPVIGFIIGLFFVYANLVFITLIFNPLLWQPSERAFFIFMGLVFGIAGATLGGIIQTNTEKG